MGLTGLSLIIIGSLFMALMMRSFLRAKQMREWPVVPCVILASEVEQRQHDPYSAPEFRARIIYGYSWHDEAYSSDTYSLRGSKWSSQRHKAEQLCREFPAGSNTTCRVNPDSPSQSVIKTDSLAPLYSIWFPGLFVIGGIGIIYRCLKPHPRAS